MSAKKKRIPIKERIAYAYRQAYRWVMRIALERGYREAVSGGGYAEIMNAWKLGDVSVGDLIEIGGKEYMFAGLNRFGGPGQAFYAQMGMPTPQFGPATPQERQIMTIFDTPSFPSWRKTGHRSVEEWEEMCKEAKAAAAA